jgi:stress response protein YsnF
MAEQDPVDRDVVIPVVQEEVSVDAMPVVTGGVRVTKRVESQNQVIEQQLRTTRADVKRVKTNRVVDGPQQPAQRSGNTLIIPVVSEVLHIEKRWVVTEEIHIAQREEVENFQETVPVNYELADIERVDESGNAEPAMNVPVERRAAPVEGPTAERTQSRRPLLGRAQPAAATASKPTSRPRSLLNKDKER